MIDWTELMRQTKGYMVHGELYTRIGFDNVLLGKLEKGEFTLTPEGARLYQPETSTVIYANDTKPLEGDGPSTGPVTGPPPLAPGPGPGPSTDDPPKNDLSQLDHDGDGRPGGSLPGKRRGRPPKNRDLSVSLDDAVEAEERFD